MEKKNLLIAGGLIGGITAFVILVFIFFLHFVNIAYYYFTAESFDNSTPEATAVSIARLNLGQWGFDLI